jgi:hypothetical protein
VEGSALVLEVMTVMWKCLDHSTRVIGHAVVGTFAAQVAASNPTTIRKRISSFTLDKTATVFSSGAIDAKKLEGGRGSSCVYSISSDVEKRAITDCKQVQLHRSPWEYRSTITPNNYSSLTLTCHFSLAVLKSSSVPSSLTNCECLISPSQHSTGTP